METIIFVKNLKKTFQDKPEDKPLLVLDNINLEIKKGEIFILLGPSGCGKSTLLRIISGLEKSYEGSVSCDHNSISFVFQQFALLPWLTVEQNVELGLIAKNVDPKERTKIVEKELKVLGLENFKSTYPKDLSGGMKQRVGIARALVTNPTIIFMDEPFSELDSFTTEELRQDLLNIWQERQPTIVMVTHNVEEAIILGDRIAVMSTRPGRIKKIIENNLPRPRQKRSEDFYKLEDELFGLVKGA